MADTPNYSFFNAPQANTQAVGTHQVSYQNHHVISSEAAGKEVGVI